MGLQEEFDPSIGAVRMMKEVPPLLYGQSHRHFRDIPPARSSVSLGTQGVVSEAFLYSLQASMTRTSWVASLMDGLFSPATTRASPVELAQVVHM